MALSLDYSRPFNHLKNCLIFSKSLKENKYIWYSFILKFILKDKMGERLGWYIEYVHQFWYLNHRIFHTFLGIFSILSSFCIFSSFSTSCIFLYFFCLHICDYLPFSILMKNNKIVQLKYRWHYYWIIQNHSTIYKIA